MLSGFEDYLSRWVALHGGANPTGIIRGWLRLTWRVARPLAARRVPPDLVTAAGLLVAAAAVGFAAAGLPVAVAVVVLLCGLLDGVDGAVAVLSGRVTRWGGVLDSLADRAGEAAFAAALFLLGGQPWWCLAAVASSWLLEYLRARAAAVGMPGIGVVTVGERPTRVIVVAVFCAVLPLAHGILGADDTTWLTVAAVVWTAAGIAGLAQLLPVVRRATLHP